MRESWARPLGEADIPQIWRMAHAAEPGPPFAKVHLAKSLAFHDWDTPTLRLMLAYARELSPEDFAALQAELAQDR